MLEYIEPYEIIEERYARMGLTIDQVRECVEKMNCSKSLLEEWIEAYYDIRDYDRLVKARRSQ